MRTLTAHPQPLLVHPLLRLAGLLTVSPCFGSSHSAAAAAAGWNWLLVVSALVCIGVLWQAWAARLERCASQWHSGTDWRHAAVTWGLLAALGKRLRGPAMEVRERVRCCSKGGVSAAGVLQLGARTSVATMHICAEAGVDGYWSCAKRYHHAGVLCTRHMCGMGCQGCGCLFGGVHTRGTELKKLQFCIGCKLLHRACVRELSWPSYVACWVGGISHSCGSLSMQRQRSAAAAVLMLPQQARLRRRLVVRSVM